MSSKKFYFDYFDDCIDKKNKIDLKKAREKVFDEYKYQLLSNSIFNKTSFSEFLDSMMKMVQSIKLVVDELYFKAELSDTEYSKHVMKLEKGIEILNHLICQERMLN